ncbi:MFS transporter [Silvibacterium acidisoli]|uniref:MFS transporter n=1 Tax=Acidobacteriaceae bacterium ZG23-2 TaxID=2883246 RepID=UPI00406C0001
MAENRLRRYRTFLLLVAGLGGLLYGVDVGIIGGALPYLEATSGLTAGQLSVIVAAVLLGSVFSTLFAGLFADWMGRKPLMALSGATFVLSIPIIALSHGYAPLFLGRLLQGMSAGFIGVVVPLYLAECLPASNRGKGTGIFQLLLVLGIVSAALIGVYYGYRVDAVAKLGDPAALFAFKDSAWRQIFWVSLPPGLLFTIGALIVSESPRWLLRRNRRDAALAALFRSRSQAEASHELEEMERNFEEERSKSSSAVKESLLKRKYILPFLLSCIVLSLHQTTGVDSVIAYNTGILLQSGLSDLWAHWGYLVYTIVHFGATLIGVALVDRKGRKFLFSIGTGGIVLALAMIGLLFSRAEKHSTDAHEAIQQQMSADGTLSLRFTPQMASALGAEAAGIDAKRAALSVIYSCGDYTAAANTVRSDDPAAKPVTISQSACLPANKTEAFFKDPFAHLDRSRQAPLRIVRATVAAVPTSTNGWLTAIGLYIYTAFYSIGPGICVWLALSELMPTRIRSNGMSIALLMNRIVSTTVAGVFLPVVARYGYSRMFFTFAAFTVMYFLVTTFLLPETKGRTLEEIESYFEGTATAAEKVF